MSFPNHKHYKPRLEWKTVSKTIRITTNVVWHSSHLIPTIFFNTQWAFLLIGSEGYLEFNRQGTPPQMCRSTLSAKLTHCPLFRVRRSVVLLLAKPPLTALLTWGYWCKYYRLSALFRANVLRHFSLLFRTPRKSHGVLNRNKEKNDPQTLGENLHCVKVITLVVWFSLWEFVFEKHKNVCWEAA